GQGLPVTTGTGAASAVSYSAGTMSLTLSGDAGAKGTVYVTLPAAYAEPFQTGQVVAVKVIDGSCPKKHGKVALPLRDVSCNLPLAADPAQLGPVLTDADLAPFAVAGTTAVVACDQDSCGKLLHYTTVFDGGVGAAELTGGQVQVVVIGTRAYQVLNVA